MNFLVYDHHGGAAMLNRGCVESAKTVIAGLTLSKRDRTTAKVRARILDGLHHAGWSDETKLDPGSAMTVTSVKNSVGLCLQTGNMGRIYADLLKLQLLFSRKKIVGAVIILYSRITARELGQNLANFDRLTKELEIFREIITVPAIVFGLEVVES
ncbi:MAG TPA: BglII/BstYI family type II restriction endonuclease [Candidatus Baltobacteraceae bacterium]|nr:BglII/BstYI family type II restriction endonuclease [Candidatus Baltobacteraceae bacterium]